jgi:hypothetical protein
MNAVFFFINLTILHNNLSISINIYDQNRYKLFRRAQQNLNEHHDWSYASSNFGVTTFYRHEKDGSLSIKLDGEIDGVPLFEQLCVLKELDLHYKWSPFCTSSQAVADLDKLDLVGWFMIGIASFGLARDGCFRCVGCDNTSEDGSIILAGRGIRDIVHSPPQEQQISSSTEIGGQVPEKKKYNGIADDDYDDYNKFLVDDPILDQLDIPPGKLKSIKN